MARPYLSFSNRSIQLSFISSTSFFAVFAVLSIFSLVTFLCTSNRTKKWNQAQKKIVSKMNSQISSKALSMAKMISWRKVEAADEEMVQEADFSDEEVWRKTIIKGERCRPLEFSGKIEYDSEGNLLSDSPDHSKENSKAVA